MKNLFTLILLVALSFASVTVLTAQESYGKTTIYKKTKYASTETTYKSATFNDTLYAPEYVDGNVVISTVPVSYFQVVTLIVYKGARKTDVKEKLQCGYNQYRSYEEMIRVIGSRYGLKITFKGGRIHTVINSNGQEFYYRNKQYTYKGIVEKTNDPHLKRHENYTPSSTF